MPTKLRKLVINEISLVDKGANQHAFVTLFKRDTPEIETPRDDAPLEFNASGRGPGHDALWTSFDNHRRQMGPAQGRKAFETAWSELSDDEKQTIRNEEAATEAAKQAAAEAAEAERKREMNKMADDEVMVKAARAIRAGTIGNTVRSSTWHGELRKYAAARQEDGETIEGAVARLVKTDADALALFRASLSGVADDVPAAAPVPVVKTDSATGKIREIADVLMKADPSMSRLDALLKVHTERPELLAKAKTEAFA
jgi:hypothetical protein